MLLFCCATWRTQVERAAALLAADTMHTLQLVTATKILGPVGVSYVARSTCSILLAVKPAICVVSDMPCHTSGTMMLITGITLGATNE